MRLEFATNDLERLYAELAFTSRLPPEVVKAYRMRCQFMESTHDERDLLVFRAWRFEHLKGDRKGQCSIRLNDQWRLVFTLRTEGGERIARIEAVEDYH